MAEVKLSFDVTSNNVSDESKIQMFCTVIKQTEDSEPGATLYKCPLDKKTEIIIEDIDSAEYTIKIKMDGKQDSDTQFDDDGIIGTAEITIDNIKFDDFDITTILEEQSTYTHNFNGYGEETTANFDKILGCNGTVEFNFTTPLYLWLLENME